MRDCARLMRDESIGFVPVCNDRGEPIGAITDRDLAIRVLADDLPASERVMVCDERGKLRGVVSLADVAEAEGEEAIGATVQGVKSDQPAGAH